MIYGCGVKGSQKLEQNGNIYKVTEEIKSIHSSRFIIKPRLTDEDSTKRHYARPPDLVLSQYPQSNPALPPLRPKEINPAKKILISQTGNYAPKSANRVPVRRRFESVRESLFIGGSAPSRKRISEGDC